MSWIEDFYPKLTKRQLELMAKKDGISISMIEMVIARLRGIHRALVEKWGIQPEILGECIKNREWFKGVVLSTAFLEVIGMGLLQSHFSGKIKPERIEHLRFEQMVMLLYASEIIEQPIYSKMIEVNQFRNDIVHFKTLLPPKLPPKKAEANIKKAVTCLKPLIKEYFKKIMKEEIDRLKLPSKTKYEKEREIEP